MILEIATLAGIGASALGWYYAAKAKGETISALHRLREMSDERTKTSLDLMATRAELKTKLAIIASTTAELSATADERDRLTKKVQELYAILEKSNAPGGASRVRDLVLSADADDDGA